MIELLLLRLVVMSPPSPESSRAEANLVETAQSPDEAKDVVVAVQNAPSLECRESTDSSTPLETVIDVCTEKEARRHEPGAWLDGAIRQPLLQVVAARFQAPLKNTDQDIEWCRSFWQQSRERGMHVKINKIPRRFRLQLLGQTLAVYERRLARWLQGPSTSPDAKLSVIMLDVLNDLILAASDTRLQSGSEQMPETFEIKSLATKPVQRAPRSRAKLAGKMAPGQRRELQQEHKKRTDVGTKIRNLAAALTKWNLSLMKRSKDGLATNAVKLASHYARLLEDTNSTQTDADMLGMIAFALHKLVQVAASLECDHDHLQQSSTYYFARLSGGTVVRVEQLCLSSITASVALLGHVWPQGFADFESVQDMPKPPKPQSGGRLFQALCEDCHLYKYGVAFHRQLLKEVEKETNSLILACASTTIESVIELVKQWCLQEEPVRAESNNGLHRSAVLSGDPSRTAVSLVQLPAPQRAERPVQESADLEETSKLATAASLAKDTTTAKKPAIAAASADVHAPQGEEAKAPRVKAQKDVSPTSGNQRKRKEAIDVEVDERPFKVCRVVDDDDSCEEDDLPLQAIGHSQEDDLPLNQAFEQSTKVSQIADARQEVASMVDDNDAAGNDEEISVASLA